MLIVSSRLTSALGTGASSLFVFPIRLRLAGCLSNVIVLFSVGIFNVTLLLSRGWLRVLLRVCHTVCVSSLTFLSPAAPPAFPVQDTRP